MTEHYPLFESLPWYEQHRRIRSATTTTETSYSVTYGTLSARIDVAETTRDSAGKVTNLQQVRTVYVHRSEYRTWEA